ncbi:MAG: PQQ-binding-like beta-propeller repeat protein [Spirochaetales bacterium]|nr:PQQ-binding-like beta-propeller repeat protein [Spirochaetales bacterium]
MKKKFLALWLSGAVVLAVLLAAAILIIPFGRYDLSPAPAPEGLSPSAAAQGPFSYGLPLDPLSPWPKFRANALQNGRARVLGRPDPEVAPWEFRTGKGIFSSPVVDGEGTVYIGSADRRFYAIDRLGKVKWSLLTGEIIDSSALLDDQGRVIFGSGDARVYCLNRETGEVLWTYQAQTAAEVSEEFGITTYNVNWFEGNIGILPNGDILAPNDNYLIYRLNRETGQAEQRYLANEMVWSLPAVNPETGFMFFGSCYNISDNILSYTLGEGKKRWGKGGLGFTAATPLLTGYRENGGVILGSYDGYLRCLTQRNGKTLWKLGLRDHIYASCAQLSTGVLIQPCADGSVYAVDPQSGGILWTFDTLEPIRSSPAIGADDLIYFGSGEGKLFCLNPDGSLRWSYQCILEGRNDLNASPALGYEGVYIAGESGEIFFVPYDYPLREENRNNPRCQTGAGESFSGAPMEDGAFLIYTAPLGGLYPDPPEEIEANGAIVFSLIARRQGRAELGLIDRNSVQVEIEGNGDFELQVSADRRFLILLPRESWRPGPSGDLALSLAGTYHTRPRRFGLKFFGGKNAGTWTGDFRFRLRPRPPHGNPFAVPTQASPSAAVIELRRQSVPLPSLLPSLNQIGFDSLHYLAGAVGEAEGKTLFWVVGGRPENGGARVDPETEVRFPLLLEYDNGLATFYNDRGFKIQFVGSWDMPIAAYRIAAVYDPGTQTFGPAPSYTVTANCDEIKFYGIGLKLMGMSDFRTGRMWTSGSMELLFRGAPGPPAGLAGPGGLPVKAVYAGGTITLRPESSLRRGEALYSLLVLDDRGLPLPLYYAKNTQADFDAQGVLESLSLKLEREEKVRGEVEVLLMVDTYPAARARVLVD